MGKTNKLLTIGISDPSMMEWPEVVSLRDKGHTILPVTVEFPLLTVEGATPIGVDLIIGPNCWMMEEALRKYLPLAIRAAREKKYKGKGVAHEVEDTLEKPEGSGERGGVVEGAVGSGVEGD